jgi:hypothetical protein
MRGKIVETTARRIPDEDEIKEAAAKAQQRLIEKGEEIYNKTGEL